MAPNIGPFHSRHPSRVSEAAGVGPDDTRGRNAIRGCSASVEQVLMPDRFFPNYLVQDAVARLLSCYPA
jgi:hypothetical protein